MKLSIVMPAYNEALNLPDTIYAFYNKLCEHNIDHEFVVVNDNSKDNTQQVIEELQKSVTSLTTVFNHGPNGFGYAIRKGLESFTGDCVAIVMADLSDSPDDLVKFYEALVQHKVDCVFGNRWENGNVKNYPKTKYFLNRLGNNLISIVFGIKYNDYTNAFKLYSKQAINGLKPFLSPHFNLTLELPLKAIVRGYAYVIVSNSWKNRVHGKSNLKIKEIGSRYFFIILYCFIEKYFGKDEFKKI